MPDVLKDKVVKTRKEQTCWGCAETFDKGTSLRFNKVVDGGHISSTYWCRICDVTWFDQHYDHDELIGFGELTEFDNWHDNARLLPRTYGGDEWIEKETETDGKDVT